MTRPLHRILVYDALRVFARTVAVTFYQIRVAGRENWPTTGGGLVCSNHQSFLDPPLIGLTCDRRMNYLARDTLFKVPVLSPVMSYLDTIPIDREGTGLSGLKETLKRLKRGELVLIFPEGTRTRDGEVGLLKPGFCSVARRSGVPLIPIGMDGAYQAWPRTSWLPQPGRLAVVIGQPLSTTEAEALSDDELVAELQRRMRQCHRQARRLRVG